MTTSLTYSSARNNLAVGDVVTFDLHSTAILYASNRAVLTLSNGAKAIYTGGSGTGDVYFSYTVSGDDALSAGLSVTGYQDDLFEIAQLPTFVPQAAVRQSTDLQVLNFAPQILDVLATTSNGTSIANEGDQILVTIVTDHPVVSGTARFIGQFVTGGNSDRVTFNLVSGLGTNRLVFSYTVFHEDFNSLTTELLTFLDNSLADSLGNRLDVTGLHRVLNVGDNAAPPHADITTSGTKFDLGQTLVIGLHDFNSALYASSDATLQLDNGGIATYAGRGNNGDVLFNYTVAAGDLAAKTLSITGITGTIKDELGNVLPLSKISNVALIAVQPTLPTVTSLVAASSGSDSKVVRLGDMLKINVTIVGGFALAGDMRLLIQFDDGFVRQLPATLVASDPATQTLTCAYAVTPFDRNASNLKVVAVNAFDAAGAAVQLPSALGSTGLTVNIAPPQVLGLVAAGSAPGVLTAGATVSFTLTTDEAVTVAAGTQLKLSNGGRAVFTGDGKTASRTNNFVYTVGPKDLAAHALAVSGYEGAIVDDVGNSLDGGLVNTSTGFEVYDVPTAHWQTVVAMASGGGAVAKSGGDLLVTLNFDEPVTPVAVPALGGAAGLVLSLNDGRKSASAIALAQPGAPSTSWTYVAHIGPSSSNSNAGFINANAVDVTVTGVQGAVQDIHGNALDLSSLSFDTGTAVDAQAPTAIRALGASSNANPRAAKAGDLVTITVYFDTPVFVSADAAAALMLSNGASALYRSGSGTSALTFTYLVGAHDANTGDLQVTGFSGLADALARAPASVVFDAAVAVDTVAPTMIDLTDYADGKSPFSLAAGDKITFKLTTDEPLQYNDGVLLLSLLDAAHNPRVARLQSVVGNVATLACTVAADDANTQDLFVTGASGLADAAGNALVWTAGYAQTGYAVDAQAPSVQFVTANALAVAPGGALTISLITDAPVYASPGAALRLSNGASAAYTQTSAGGVMQFTYVPTVSDASTLDLKVVGYSGKLVDWAGRALPSTGWNYDLRAGVENGAPTVESIQAVSNGADPRVAALGDVITVTITANQALTSAGAVSLDLSFRDGSATRTVTTGLYAVTQNVVSLSIGTSEADFDTSDIKLVGLSGFTNLLGAPLALPPRLNSLGLAFQASPPTVASLTASATSNLTGAVGVGDSLLFRLTTSRPVTISADASLTLSNGAQARYLRADAGAALFEYRPTASDAATGDLSVTGYAGAIVDAGGRPLASGGVNLDSGFAVDIGPPSLLSIDASASDVLGSTLARPGDTIIVQLSADRPLALGASPALTLQFGDGSTALATDVVVNGANATFRYAITAQDHNAKALRITALSGLTDLYGAPLTFDPRLALTAIAVDAQAPSAHLTVASTSGPLGPGAQASFTLHADTPLIVGPGAALSLNNAATATFTGYNSDGDPTFAYVVAPGDGSVFDLTVTGYVGLIADLSGQAVSESAVQLSTGLRVQPFATPAGFYDPGSANVAPLPDPLGSFSDPGAVRPTTDVAGFLSHGSAYDQIASGFDLRDRAANIAAAFDLLNADPHIHAISFSDPGAALLALTVKSAETDANARAKLTGFYALEVADSLAKLKALTPMEIDALAAAGFTLFAATSPGNLTFTAAQSDALVRDGVVLKPLSGSTFRETLDRGGYALFNDAGPLSSKIVSADGAYALTRYQLNGAFYGAPYAKMVSTYDRGGALTSQRYFDVSGAEVGAKFLSADGGYLITLGGAPYIEKTVGATGYDLRRYQSPGVFYGISYAGVDFSYDASGFNYDQIFYDASGAQIAERKRDAGGGFIVYLHGIEKQYRTYAANGSYATATYQITGAAYDQAASLYRSDGVLLGSALHYVDNTGAVTLRASNLSLSMSGGRMSLYDADGLGSVTFDLGSRARIVVAGVAHETLQFSLSGEAVSISGLTAAALADDRFVFAAADFGAVPGDAAADFQALLNYAQETASHSTVIADIHGGALTLQGVNKAMLAANAASFLFT